MGSQNKKEPPDKGVSEHASTVLTGGHGGAVPAAIVKIVKKVVSKFLD
ncbi:MAG: hypothetical protein PVF58_06600 [Candidatus Methanofastidiosia archaeon]|jgi:hypothetical protein